MGLFQDDRAPELPAGVKDRSGMRASGARFIALGVLMMASELAAMDALGPHDILDFVAVAGLGSLVFGIIRYRAAK